MNVLGLDTSTAASAACVLRADGAAFEELPAVARLGERPAHAAELLPAAVRCLDAAGLDWDGLDAIAVGVGPGAFTGLRIGVATARALATATGLPLHPVPSLAALAAGARAAIPEAGARPLLALIDARRGELFAALYPPSGATGGDGSAGARQERGPAAPGRAAAAPAPDWGPVALAPAQVAARAAAAAAPPLAVGDGALRHRDELVAAGVEIAPPDAPAHAVSALATCRLAVTVAPVAAEAVVPDYLRDPDAVPSAA
ncbi:MAG: tRNA (adenosine(37)-N6)-threonylcarbamoyltransferase complex dimerization subunit type 1 TsaB [Solirubrobacterales bacterium]|nr:tRNA (adenosine(37)-N6)-threonylcarbamoyltransferase complex dimerization subunit type 1 TsaB [Solirubrobacterales bacterium]